MPDKDEIYSLLGKYKMPLFVREYEQVEYIPTGSLVLDACFGGGLPCGRATEIGGLRSYGKTTLATAICAAIILAGGRVAYIDVESTFDIGWAEALGVEDAGFLLFQRSGDVLSTAEEALQLVRDLVRRNEEFGLDLIVFDSVAAMAPRAMMEGDMDSKTFAARARLLEQFYSVIPGDLRASRVALLMLNQGRIDVASQAKDKTIFPGGLARQHAYSIMVKMLQPEPLKADKDEREMYGWTFRGYTTKNKTAPPGREFELDLRYEPFVHVDRVVDLYRAANRFKLFLNKAGQPRNSQEGHFIMANGELISVGRAAKNVQEEMQENPDLCVALEQTVRSCIEASRNKIQKPERVEDPND